jgi:hypothetical protein
LQRVTILTARADSAVLVQAEYFPPQLPVVFDGVEAGAAPSAPNPLRLSAIELYSRTQRGSLGEKPRAALLDVLA